MLLFNFYASMQICAFDKLDEKVGLKLYANVRRQLLQLHSEFQLAATASLRISIGGDNAMPTDTVNPVSTDFCSLLCWTFLCRMQGKEWFALQRVSHLHNDRFTQMQISRRSCPSRTHSCSSSIIPHAVVLNKSIQRNFQRLPNQQPSPLQTLLQTNVTRCLVNLRTLHAHYLSLNPKFNYSPTLKRKQKT